MSNWETVIGLEVHAQLQTKSKLFSGSSTAFGSEPNTQANEVDLALPGTLPVMNIEAAKMGLKLGLALGAELNLHNVFARKNYFYPDLPKGYQTSQLDLPIVGKGSLTISINGEEKIIGVTRAHLEEDAGKSLHENFQDMTGIDLNRAGTPLLEIVSEPDMRSAQEAVAYLKKLHSLVRYIDICDGNMQEGSFRCDANVSVRLKGQTELGTRTELKNINSFRFVEKAIEHEVERQIDILEDGGEIIQETRLYDPDKNETRSMRSKEEAHDYRYFPCPDLPPMHLDQALVEEIKASLPELPEAKKSRFIEQFSLNEADALVLTQDRETADFFETVQANSQGEAKITANWIAGELFAHLNKENLSIHESPISTEQFTDLMNRIADKTLSGKTAKQVFAEIWENNTDVDSVIEQKGLKQITDTGAIETIVGEVIASCPDQVQQYKDGNDKVIGFLVGQVMQRSKGKANPQMANELLKQKLD